jgi:hypothetical protein
MADLSPKQVIEQAQNHIPLKDLSKWQEKISRDVKSEYEDLEKLKLKDINWRLKTRQKFKNFLIFLLVGQNLAVFSLFGIALSLNRLSGLENVFSVVIGGTLVETTSLILIIIKWLFSEIPYNSPDLDKA